MSKNKLSIFKVFVYILVTINFILGLFLFYVCHYMVDENYQKMCLQYKYLEEELLRQIENLREQTYSEVTVVKEQLKDVKEYIKEDSESKGEFITNVIACLSKIDSDYKNTSQTRGRILSTKKRLKRLEEVLKKKKEKPKTSIYTVRSIF